LTEPFPRHVTESNLSLSFYPLEHLVALAREGDLFVFHLIREGKPIDDPESVFPRLQAEFTLRDSYSREIGHASDLGWFLANCGENLFDLSLVNRRIGWCVRTILIARSAELGEPIYSATRLAEFSGLPSVFGLLRHRKDKEISPGAVAALKDFLAIWGQASPVRNLMSEEAFARHFEETNNEVAIRTIEWNEELMKLYS